jgi:hypothetical protein
VVVGGGIRLVESESSQSAFNPSFGLDESGVLTVGPTNHRTAQVEGRIEGELLGERIVGQCDEEYSRRR